MTFSEMTRWSRQRLWPAPSAAPDGEQRLDRHQIAAWHQQHGERWAPAALVRRLAETGTPFRDAKPGRPM